MLYSADATRRNYDAHPDCLRGLSLSLSGDTGKVQFHPLRMSRALVTGTRGNTQAQMH